MSTDNASTDRPLMGSPKHESLSALGTTTPAGRAERLASLVIVALLFAVSLTLVFRGGAYGPSAWLPLIIVVGALSLVLALALLVDH